MGLACCAQQGAGRFVPHLALWCDNRHSLSAASCAQETETHLLHHELNQLL